MKYLLHIAVFVIIAGCHPEVTTIAQFERWLELNDDVRFLQQQPFATTPLSHKEAQEAAELIHRRLKADLRQKYAAQWSEKTLALGTHKMPFEYKTFGEKPPEGWSLYISMHGGGNTSQEMNDRQWKNQLELYRPEEGIYIAPRAPDNSWNMWHKSYVDSLFCLLIQLADVFEDINTNRVYLMGYSAGGDGTYQLAPRMADRLAAAAMMAGHPNDASPVSLRNLPFTLHMGAEDSAYNRNGIASDWATILDELQNNDPEGYIHDVQIYKKVGHWMEQRDTTAVAWMAQFGRDAYPRKITWDQNGKQHSRFYWLALPENNRQLDAVLIVSCEYQLITIEEARNVNRLIIYLNDELLSLDDIVEVEYNKDLLFRGKPERTIATVWETMKDRNDPRQVFSARIEVYLN